MADVTQQVVAVVTLRDLMSGKLKGIQGNLSKLERYGGRAASALSQNLERAALVGGAAAIYGVKKVIDLAADWDTAMARVSKTLTPLERTQLPKLSEELLNMSKRLPITAVGLAEIAREAGQLGIPLDEMSAFVETMAKLASVTELDLTYAAENMGKLRTIFHMSQDDLASYANTLVDLENNAASTVQEILNVSRRFAGAGQAAGLSAKQVAAFASTITSLGILPEAGGSALSRIFNRTRQEFALNSKKAKEFSKVLGLSFKEARTMLATDPTTFFTKFFKAYDKLQKSGSKVDQLKATALLRSLGIVNVRDISAVQKLSDGWAELVRQLALADKPSKALDEAAEARFKAFQSQLQLFQNKLNVFAIKVGTKLFPALLGAFDSISQWFDRNQDKIAAFGDTLAGALREILSNLNGANLDKIASALGTAYDWSKKIIGAFMGMPDWLRNILIGLYVGNKLTGGVVADLVGELGKGLIKGILGISAAIVNINAAAVNGGIGIAGAAGAAGTGATIAAILRGLAVRALIVTAVAEVASMLSKPIVDLGGTIHDSIFGSSGNDIFSQFGRQWDNWRANADWPWGQKNAPEWAGGTGNTPANNIQPHIMVPDDIQRVIRSQERRESLMTAEQKKANAHLAALREKAEANRIATAAQASSIATALATVGAISQSIGDTFTEFKREQNRINEFSKTLPNNEFMPDVKLDPSQVTDLRNDITLMRDKIEGNRIAVQSGTRTISNAVTRARPIVTNINRNSTTVNVTVDGKKIYQATYARTSSQQTVRRGGGFLQ